MQVWFRNLSTSEDRGRFFKCFPDEFSTMGTHLTGPAKSGIFPTFKGYNLRKVEMPRTRIADEGWQITKDCSFRSYIWGQATRRLSLNVMGIGQKKGFKVNWNFFEGGKEWEFEYIMVKEECMQLCRSQVAQCCSELLVVVVIDLNRNWGFLKKVRLFYFKICSCITVISYLNLACRT